MCALTLSAFSIHKSKSYCPHYIEKTAEPPKARNIPILAHDGIGVIAKSCVYACVFKDYAFVLMAVTEGAGETENSPICHFTPQKP